MKRKIYETPQIGIAQQKYQLLSTISNVNASDSRLSEGLDIGYGGEGDGEDQRAQSTNLWDEL